MTVVDEVRLLVLEIERDLPGVTGFAPLPNAVDGACARIVQLYAAASAAERVAIRAAGTPAQYRIMLTFCDRMAVLCVRTRDEARLYEAAVAHAVEDFRWDPRENLLRLALVHHSASVLGVDGAALCVRVADLASPHAAAYLRRAPLSLAQCGYRAIDGPDGFSYTRDW